MTMFIFIGDMLVMAFMMGLAVWFLNRGDDESIARVARIPLDDEVRGEERDEDYHGS